MFLSGLRWSNLPLGFIKLYATLHNELYKEVSEHFLWTVSNFAFINLKSVINAWYPFSTWASCNYIYILQVEALAVQLTQREGELIQEKEEVKKLADFLKQVKRQCRVLLCGTVEPLPFGTFGHVWLDTWFGCMKHRVIINMFMDSISWCVDDTRWKFQIALF